MHFRRFSIRFVAINIFSSQVVFLSSKLKFLLIQNHSKMQSLLMYILSNLAYKSYTLIIVFDIAMVALEYGGGGVLYMHIVASKCLQENIYRENVCNNVFLNSCSNFKS